jgi:hypothetical protein
MLSYVFFWDVLRRMKFSCQRLRALGPVHFHGRMKIEQTDYCETVATKLHTAENIPK